MQGSIKIVNAKNGSIRNRIEFETSQEADVKKWPNGQKTFNREGALKEARDMARRWEQNCGHLGAVKVVS